MTIKENDNNRTDENEAWAAYTQRLFAAVKKSPEDLANVEDLLEEGGQRGYAWLVDDHSQTALHHAAIAGSLPVVKVRFPDLFHIYCYGLKTGGSHM